MSFIGVENALLTAVSSTLSGWAIEYPNSRFTAPTGTKYARVFVVQGGSEAMTLGTGGTDEDVGFLQIDMFYPLDIDRSTSSTDYDTVRASFKRGTVFTASGQSVRCTSCTRTEGQREDDRYRITVTCYWQAEIAR